ncbi:MAG: vitamin K epoxide reductase family protein [Patescibacteria group bacterium]
MNLKILLTKPLQQESIPKWIIITLLIVALLGFIDATYLTIEHFQNNIPPCTTDGCEKVLTSSYSEVIGIPVALLGSIYYFTILVLLIAYFDSKKEILLRLTMLLTPLGFLASLYFFILQAAVINAFCQYCLVSAVTSTVLFVFSMYSFAKYRE